MTARQRRLGLLAGALMMGFGCNKFVPVQGLVTLDGKPLGRATVMFVPENYDGIAVLPAAGTEDDGTFSLATHNQEGALPGSYKVKVSKVKIIFRGASNAAEQKSMEEPTDDAVSALALSGPVQRVKALLPARYNDLEETPLRVEVPSGGKRDVLLELSSQAR